MIDVGNKMQTTAANHQAIGEAFKILHRPGSVKANFRSDQCNIDNDKYTTFYSQTFTMQCWHNEVQ